MRPGGRRVWQTVRRYAPAGGRGGSDPCPAEADLGRRRPKCRWSGLAGQPVAAFCGIGNPAGFRHTLEACGCRLARLPRISRPSPLHAGRLGGAVGVGQAGSARPLLLCTGKDLVKLSADRFGDPPLWAVRHRDRVPERPGAVRVAAAAAMCALSGSRTSERGAQSPGDARNCPPEHGGG